jgi:UDPglucose 6-dehydrogenase
MDMIDKEGLSDLILVASNPEFLREGSAMHDFFRPDRIVIGADSQIALDKVADLYAPLYRNKTPIIKTTLETSELSKYASNAFLATKISFVNEMACLCDKMGADVRDIANIMGMDGRIGQYFLHPGPGYGGSCFPKDTQALIQTSAKLGYDLKIVKAAENVNKKQKGIAFSKVTEFLGDLSGKTIGVLGLAFKPNTDDVRDSSSIELINDLLKLKANVKVYDPEAMEHGRAIWGDSVSFCKNSYEVSADSDAVVLMTEWNAFRELDLARIKSLMTGDVFIDMRNVYDHDDFRRHGYRFYLIGRPQG